MNDEPDNANGKKPYQKPLLRRMAIRADEVLAKNCKGSGVAPGPSGVGCNTPKCFNLKS